MRPPDWRGFQTQINGVIQMLVLSREVNQKIIITAPDGTKVIIMVVEIRGHKSRLAIDAPRSWSVNREEIQEQVDNDKT